MSQDNQPDWNAMAEKFDLWVPFIKPVGDKMLAAIKINEGDYVLDVASGTGEPALSLAKEMQNKIRLIGTDAMEGMVKVAQSKAFEFGFDQVQFKTMPAEKLDFAENTFDKIICRFGVMLFQDPQQGLKEMHRVLKPGGHFVLAVWNTPETMPIMNWSYQVFKGKIDDAILPAIEKLTSMSGVGVMDNLLEEAGFSEYEIKTEHLDYKFDSFQQYWDLVEASDILKMQLDALPEGLKPSVQNELAQFAREHEQPGGQLSVPHQYLLVIGKK